jgi:hypothetical protein
MLALGGAFCTALTYVSAPTQQSIQISPTSFEWLFRRHLIVSYTALAQAIPLPLPSTPATKAIAHRLHGVCDRPYSHFGVCDRPSAFNPLNIKTPIPGDRQQFPHQYPHP